MLNIGCLCLLFSLSLLALRILKAQAMFAVTLLGGLFSILSALLYTMLGAPDVALTESAIGAGLSTIMSLVTLFVVRHVFDHPLIEEQKPEDNRSYRLSNLRFRYLLSGLVMTILVLFAIALRDFPIFGDFTNPPINNTYFVSLGDSFELYHIDNAVSMILGSFRSLDTMCETMVIFVSALVVMTILTSIKGKPVDIVEPISSTAAQNNANNTEGSKNA